MSRYLQQLNFLDRPDFECRSITDLASITSQPSRNRYTPAKILNEVVECDRDDNLTCPIEGASPRDALTANTAISKTVVSASLVEPIVVGVGYAPLAYDDTIDQVLCMVAGTRLYRATWDGASTFTPTLVFDLTINNSVNPDYAFYAGNTAIDIQEFWCRNGTWLLVLGVYQAPVAGTNTGRMYRSVDYGATWTQVLATDYGFIFHVLECDGFLAVGSYISAIAAYWTKYNNNVWVSYDDGETWDKVLGDLDFTVPADNTTRHNHGIVGGVGDEFLFICGDAKSSIIRHVTRPVGWQVGDGTGPDPLLTDEENSAGDWDSIDVSIDFQGNGGVHKNGKFYVTCSGSGFTAATPGRVVSIDPTNNYKLGQFLFPPDDVAATNGYLGSINKAGPYNYNSDVDSWAREIIEHEDRYYIFLYKYTTDTTDWAKGIGLYVSTDLENWTAIARSPSIFGQGRTAGVWHNRYFIQQRDSYPGSVIKTHVAFVPIPKLESIQAPIVSLGYKNYAGPTNINNCIFVANTGQWAYSTHDTRRTMSFAPNEGLYGANALKCTYLADATSHSAYTPGGYVGSILDGLGGDTLDHLVTGVFVSWLVWVRLAPQCPDCWTVNPRLFGTGYDAQSNRFLIGHEWQRIYGTSYVTATPPANIYPNLVWETPTVVSFAGNHGFATDAEGLLKSKMFVDGAVLFLHNDRWLSYSLPIVLGGTSPYMSTNNIIRIPLSKTSQSWSITFEWFPMEGIQNFPHVAGVSSPLPIACIEGAGGSYLTLQWDRQNKVFELVDADLNCIELTATAVSHRWLHYDVVKFGLVSNGTDTVLYMFMPENYEVNGQSIESVLCTGVKLSNPNTIKLGTNFIENDVSCGAFTNIRFWLGERTANQIAVSFNSPQSMIQEQSTRHFET